VRETTFKLTQSGNTTNA